MNSPNHTAARTSATIVGAPLAAVGLGLAAARFLPLSEPAAFAWGVHVILPVWTTLLCVLPLQKSGLRAWMICGCLTLPAALALGWEQLS